MKSLKFVLSCYFFQVIFLSSCFTVYSLTAGNCNHAKTSDNVLNLISCMDNLMEKHMENFVKEYKDQLRNNGNTYDIARVKDKLVEILNDAQPCVTQPLTNCFGSSYENLAKLFFDGIKPIFENVDISQDPEDNLQEFIREFENLVGNDPDQFIENNFKSDEKCSLDRIIETTGEEIGEPCLENQFKNLEPLYEYIYESGKNFPSTASVCQTMDSTMGSCLVSTSCISTREMGFIKNVTLHIYNMLMDKSMKIKEQFGTISDMVDTFKATTLKYDDVSVTASQIYEELELPQIDSDQIDRVIRSVNSVFDDYKGENCKTKLAALTKELEPLKCHVGERGSTLSNSCPSGSEYCAKVKTSGVFLETFKCSYQSLVKYLGLTDVIDADLKCKSIWVGTSEIEYCLCKSNDCNDPAKSSPSPGCL